MPEHHEQAGRTRGTGTADTTATGRVTAIRGAGFFALWLVLLPSVKTADLLFGLTAASAATWLSLYLLPPADGRLGLGKLLRVLPHFLYESTRGGIDVAFRALAPSLPIRPGLLTYTADLPAGLARNTFASVTSLLPGTFACGEAGESVVFHALDLEQPVTEQLRGEERRLAAALVAGHRHE